MTNNSGINIGGGTFNNTAMAAGSHAQATNITPPPQSAALDDLRRQMADLVDLVRMNPSQLTDRQQAIAAAGAAQQELTSSTPDKRRLLAALERLAKGVGSVGSIATAVAAIQQAAASFF